MVLKIIDSNNIKKLYNKMQNNKTKYRKINRNNRNNKNNKKTLIVMLNKNNRNNRSNRNNKNKTRKTKCMYNRNNNRKLNMNKVKFNNRILNIKKLLNNITENTVKKRMTKRVSIANLINNVNTKKQTEMINMNKRNNTLCKSKRDMIHKKNNMNNMNHTNNKVTKSFKSSYETHNINGKKTQKGFSVYKNSRYPYGIMRSIDNNTLTETLIPN